ncbi:MAG: hypothetical protein AB1942_12540 [Pseudomonadota bacterium]
MHLDGQVRADCGSGEVTCASGSLLVLDLRQPCVLQVSGMRSLSLALPREAVLPHLGGFDPHGLTTSGGLTPMLIRTAQAAADSLPELQARHAPALERTLVGLAVAALREALQSAQARRRQNEALVSRVRFHLDADLTAPIDAATLCATLGVSRSSLYRALAPFGGVQRFRQASPSADGRWILRLTKHAKPCSTKCGSSMRSASPMARRGAWTRSTEPPSPQR